ncbi:Membrane transport protein mmpL8 [Polystyrenella longa]|uniref:Membrane transport protein mmpL8 n=1 Tax=Polystyrenella longa TaxID=2528007 RepID=A0A518CS61_9PLAN|nr:MMPL family transporter [Polystyrenella longa]QDU82077.1 Membrane transport protein mmpL8 [Polystyrenella longa]
MIPLWIASFLLLALIAPSFKSMLRDGEFAFLPADSPSLEGERLLAQAFPQIKTASQVVIVANRQSKGEELQDQDKKFLTEQLVPRLEKLVEEEGGYANSLATVDNVADGSDGFNVTEPVETNTTETAPESEEAGDTTPIDTEEEQNADSENAPVTSEESSRSRISRIKTFEDRFIGPLLISEDKQAALVIVEFSTEFLDKRSFPTIQKIEQIIVELEPQVPDGLNLALSGSSTVGRDIIEAAQQSASATELWTVLLVVILLILIYRAPFLALIPLITVYIATKFALTFLALLASYNIIGLFNGVEIYVTVVLYGAGVDYCMFLISRYSEELDSGISMDEAMEKTIGSVGAALAASAGTTICGLAMMAFAEFGKFHQAGIAMSLSLVFVLAAALTLTPALLIFAGRWAFWPQVYTERIKSGSGWVSPTSVLARMFEAQWVQSFWDWVGQLVLRRPATVWLVTIGLMTPFALISIFWYHNLSYGLLSELPAENTSVQGAEAVQEHFPAGTIGPVTLLIKNNYLDFALEDEVVLEELVQNLNEVKEEFGIIDVRALTQPLGQKHAHELPESDSRLARATLKNRVQKYYVGDADINQGDGATEEIGGNVARIEILFDKDPFSRFSIDQLNKFENSLIKKGPDVLLPEDLQSETELHLIGPPASVRDLKTVTRRDQVLIHVLVICGVLLVLIMLLKRIAISVYLIFTVFISYLATLGLTFVVFWSFDPMNFSGLDWKVPIFLFTILIAVGEDYNIYLIARINEEQRRHGTVQGIIVALSKTGSIISSCGIIMAGTFASLIAGSLTGMHQLGFALAFGVLLDTFIVRPILVPAYLVMLHTDRFGKLGPFLGSVPEEEELEEEEEASLHS